MILIQYENFSAFVCCSGSYILRNQLDTIKIWISRRKDTKPDHNDLVMQRFNEMLDHFSHDVHGSNIDVNAISLSKDVPYHVDYNPNGML